MNNRELATLILLGVFATFVVWNRSTRTTLPTLAKQLFASKLTILLALWAATLLATVWFAHQLHMWSPDLLGATFLWFLFVGFVWFVNLGRASKDQDFFKRRMLETLGFAAVLEFFVNAQVLPLLLEVPGQTFILFVVLLNAFASRDKQYKPVATLTSVILVLASVALLSYSGVELAANWETLDKRDLANELLLPAWLAGTSLPILYLIAIYMGYESLFTRMSFLNDGRRLSLRARLGIALELRGALVDVNEFRGLPARDAARTRSVSEARRAVVRFKQERTADFEARAAARETLRNNAGREGVDEKGLLVDRREFAETKDALTWIATCHMGWYRNEDRPDNYRTDLLEILGGSRQLEFPTPDPITMVVRKDRRAWYAYRYTPAGHVFGIGASGPPPSQWFYDGGVPPYGFPSSAAIGWTDYVSPDRPEWRSEPQT